VFITVTVVFKPDGRENPFGYGAGRSEEQPEDCWG